MEPNLKIIKPLNSKGINWAARYDYQEVAEFIGEKFKIAVPSSQTNIHFEYEVPGEP